jgi:hypothetical protein
MIKVQVGFRVGLLHSQKGPMSFVLFDGDEDGTWVYTSHVQILSQS